MFFFSVFLLPIYIMFLKKWTPGQVWCKSFSLLSLCFNMASVQSILLIACDRYRAVKDPLHYVRINSKWRARILVICIWLFSLAVAAPIIFGFPELDYDTCDIKVSSTRSIFDPSVIYEVTVILTSFILPFLSVTCLYYGMYRAAKNNLARCERYSCSSCGSSDVAVNMKSQSSSGGSEYSLRRHLYTLEGENSRQKNRFLNKNRAAITGLLVVFSFIIFWSPYFIIRFYQQFKVVTIQVKFWAQFSTYLSSIVDPYVYFYRNRSTWNYTKNLLSRIFRRRKASMYLPTHIAHNIVTISNLCNISASQSRTVTSDQSMENRCFCRFSKSEQNGKVKITLYEQDSLQKKNNKQSPDEKKTIAHQNSSSSNNSSDLCPSVVNSDSGEAMHYQ